MSLKQVLRFAGVFAAGVIFAHFSLLDNADEPAPLTRLLIPKEPMADPANGAETAPSSRNPYFNRPVAEFGFPLANDPKTNRDKQQIYETADQRFLVGEFLDAESEQFDGARADPPVLVGNFMDADI